MSQPCRDITPLLGPFSDGELEPHKHLEVESHVADCEVCRERVLLDEAMRRSLRRMTQSTTSESFRDRVRAAVAAEQARGNVRESESRSASSARWRTLVPLATAAAFALVWSSVSRGPARTNVQTAGVSGDLLADLVAEHSNPVPPGCATPQDMAQLERYVGVPVHPSTLQRRAGAKLVCGRVLPINQARAAMLQYEIEQGSETRRVSVIVFDPNRIQVDDTGLTAHPVGTAEVRFGHSRGYAVAVHRSNGVGYAVASDLDENRVAQLAVYTADE